MFLQINGEKREYPEGLTIAALVAQLGMKPDRVAVELNFEIVPRAKWDASILKEGDELEVVHFVGGGSAGIDGAVLQTQPAPGGDIKKVRQCPTCGSQVTSQFCPNCGEKKFGASDLSLHHFFHHALGDFFHFDSKMFGSFRLLFTKPGFLTGEYLRGCRKPYLHPFQLFFIANLIYFILQPFAGWSGLRTTLRIQTHMMSYSSMATRMVNARIAAKGVTPEIFAHNFDHAVDVQARSLAIVMVLLYTVLVAILQWRKKNFFGQHLVFSLHYTAFLLLAVMIGFYGGCYWIFRLAATQNVSLPVLNSDNYLFVVAMAILALYGARAIHLVYRDSMQIALLKGTILAVALHYVLEVYRFILFLIALYSS